MFDIRRATRLLVVMLVVLLGPRFAGLAGAHDPGLSSLDVTVEATRVRVRLSLSPRDAALAARFDDPREVTPATLANVAAPLGAFAADQLALTVNGRPVPAMVEGVSFDDAVTVVVTLVFSQGPGARLALSSHVATRLARGHRHLVTVRGAGGAIVTERMLDGGGDGMVALDVPVGPATRARQFLVLGLEHILSGFDHLLFLAGLLLGVPGARQAVTTASAFTLGHSLTLVCSVLGVVTVPSAIVEPLIAASIAYVGVENILRPSTRSRWKTALAFGLIHGFGFAGALYELGLGAGGVAIALPIACFNLGVESGQVIVATAVWPVLQFMRTRIESSAAVLRVCSAVVATAGVAWLVVRVVV